MTINIGLTERCSLNCKHCFALKRNIDMDKQTLDNTIDFIAHRFKILREYNLTREVEFMGGEVGLVDPALIEYTIDRLNALTNSTDIKYKTYTNLTYNLTDNHIKAFKRLDEFGTSYDYAIRFNTMKKEALWRTNLQKCIENGLNPSCSICATNTLITTVTPQMFMDYLMALGLKEYTITLLSYPCDGRKDYDKPVNRDCDKWLYEVFLLYEELKKASYAINIFLFEAIRDAVRGNSYSDFQRSCQKQKLSIAPNGDVSQCIFTQAKPFYNVNTKKLNQNVFENWVAAECKIPEPCKKCKYFKYCKGNCHLTEWDETGCISQKLIFEHILKEEGKL